jgi:hypothetical protein
MVSVLGIVYRLTLSPDMTNLTNVRNVSDLTHCHNSDKFTGLPSFQTWSFFQQRATGEHFLEFAAVDDRLAIDE